MVTGRGSSRPFPRRRHRSRRFAGLPRLDRAGPRGPHAPGAPCHQCRRRPCPASTPRRKGHARTWTATPTTTSRSQWSRGPGTTRTMAPTRSPPSQRQQPLGDCDGHLHGRHAGDWWGGAAGCLVSRPPAARCAPLPPPKFPPPDVVDRERRRAERRAKERAEREAAERATLDSWAGYPDPCNVLQNETNSIWTLPPGVPPQPAPSRHADAHVQGYCNLGCETPKRLRTNVCLGRCYRPIIQTRTGTVHKHHFCSPCDRARTARDR